MKFFFLVLVIIFVCLIFFLCEGIEEDEIIYGFSLKVRLIKNF